MKNSTAKGKREEEVADKAIQVGEDEMTEIKKFIRRKQLQNQVLKKLSEEIENNISIDLNKPKSA